MFFSPEPVRRWSGPIQAPDVPAYRQVYPQLVAELRRARRYEHKFAVALVSPHALATGSSRAKSGATSFLSMALPSMSFASNAVPPTIYFLLGSYLRNTLRESDLLTAAPEAMSYAIFLPETDRVHAEHAIERLRTGFRACAGVALRAGCAEFPHDGLTIEDLLDRARNAWQQADDRELTSPTPREASHG
jgi:hypothetical protein